MGGLRTFGNLDKSKATRMCLIKNSQWHTPLRKGNIRYKVVQINGDKSFRSLFRSRKKWRVGLWYACDAHIKLDSLRYCADNYNLGFHVFVTFKDAWAYRTLLYNNSRYVIVQVKVKNHIASGVWDATQYTVPNETWQYCKIVKAYKDPRNKCA